MQSSNLVSIIIPLYNAEQFISETIQSVINQTYQNWELLIIDDLSTDNSVGIIRKNFSSENRIKIFSMHKNTGGPAAPRNRGIEKANGKYIAFLDSDDIWHPQKLEFQINLLINENINFCASKHIQFKGVIKNFPSFNKSLFDKFNEIGIRTLLHKNIIPNSSVVIKRDLIGESRLDERTKFVSIEDFDFWLELMQKSGQKCFKLETPLLYYRIVDSSISRNKIKMLKKFYLVLKKRITKLGLSRLMIYYFLGSYISLSIIENFKLIILRRKTI